MNMEKEFLEKMQDAEMILIGLGEEFDCIKSLRQREEYCHKREILEKNDKEWLIPVLNQVYGHGEYERVCESLRKLAEALGKKNYFVVSTSLNDIIRDVPWREGRLVMPCGGSRLKQCVGGCEDSIARVREEERIRLEKDILNTDAGQMEQEAFAGEVLGTCPVCGGKMALNNIYLEQYAERGYLEQWAVYTKWLQGTLNRRLLVLELGVTMQCPSVIRWPFEKITFFNDKAYMYRINEKIYQLTEELKGKGAGISQNAIDWLQFLC